MAIKAEDTSASTEEKMPAVRRSICEGAEILIYEECHSGAIKRIVDPTELGIAKTFVTKPQESQETALICSEDKRQPVALQPVHPTIYEEAFGGTVKRIIPVGELASLSK